MGNSLSGDLLELGLGFGAGLGLGAGPFIVLAMLLERWLDKRKVNKIRASRRPPSMTAVTQEIPKVVE